MTCGNLLLPFGAALMIAVLAPAQGAERIPVSVNGERLATPARLVPSADRTILPMRALFEAIGARVAWIGEEKTAYAWTADGRGVRIPVGESEAAILRMSAAPEPGNWGTVTETVPLDAPARIIDGRVFVPLRVASEALQANVRYSAAGPDIDIRTEAVAGRREEAPPEPMQTCVNRQVGYEVPYPAGWRTNPGEVLPECSVFDPQPIQLERGTEIPFSLAVVIRAESVPFERAASPGEHARVLSREETTIDGHRAVRLETRSTGAALAPAGQRSYQYLVDLNGKTLIAATYDAGALSYEKKKQILDRMMAGLRFTGRR